MILVGHSNPVASSAEQAFVSQSQQIIQSAVIALFVVLVFSGERPVEYHAVVLASEIPSQAKNDLRVRRTIYQ